MSLIVYAYRRDPKTGKMEDLDTQPLPPQNDMAGLESWRTNVWGSNWAKQLGLTLIPSLAEHDIYAEGDDLERLGTEVETLLRNLSGFAASANGNEDGLRFRLENIKEAIRLALAEGERGGVYIG